MKSRSYRYPKIYKYHCRTGVNEEEFLKQYMGESGIFEQSRAFGRRKAEEDIVEDYFKHFGTNESYNNFFREKDKKI